MTTRVSTPTENRPEEIDATMGGGSGGEEKFIQRVTIANILPGVGSPRALTAHVLLDGELPSFCPALQKDTKGHVEHISLSRMPHRLRQLPLKKKHLSIVSSP